MRINTNGDTTSGNHGTRKSVSGDRQYKSATEALKMESSRRIQLQVSKKQYTLYLNTSG